MLILLVAFLACRADVPADCQRVQISVPAQSVALCSRPALLAAIEWIRDHDGFEIRGPIHCFDGVET
jgi:hypothetical protein